MRSQGRPGAGLPITCCPTSPPTSFSPQLSFNALVLLPLTSRTCRCGRSLDSGGHHRASCAKAGVLGRRGFALESMLARICQEAGPNHNIMVRDLDLEHLQGPDGRRLEVADGPPNVWRSTTCVGHDVGECTQGRWDREERCCGCWWSGSGSSTKEEGSHLPRACGNPSTSPSGGACPGRGRPVVDGELEFLSQLVQARARGEPHVKRGG